VISTTLASTIVSSQFFGIDIIVGTIQNANFALSTSSFILQIGSQIQSSGLSLTFAEDSFIGTATVTKDSERAGDLTRYTLTFEPKNSIPSNGRVKITFPSQVGFNIGDPTPFCTVTIFGTNKIGFTVVKAG